MGRRSGDEFLALLTAPEEKEPGQWANSLLDQTSVRLRYVHNVSTPERQPGASIGVYIAIPAHQCTTREMFRRADGAMYEAKRRDTPICYWSQALEHLDPVTARPQTRLRDEASSPAKKPAAQKQSKESPSGVESETSKISRYDTSDSLNLAEGYKAEPCEADAVWEGLRR